MASVKQQIKASGKLKTDVSGISSDPGDMSQADNALLARDGLIEARHGHQRIPFTTGNGDGASGWIPTSRKSEDFISFTQADSNQTLSTYYVHSIAATDASSRKLGVYAKVADDASIDETFTFTNGNTFQSSPATGSKNNTAYSVQPESKVFTANNKVFVMTDNGLYGADIKDPTPTLRKEINAGWMPYASTAKYWETAGELGNNWMNSSKMISCRFVIEEETANAADTSRRVTWSVSRPMEIMLTEFNQNWSVSTIGGNTSAFPNIMPTVAVSFGSDGTSSIPNNSNYFLKIYRTLQYDIGDVAPTAYYLAAPEVLLNTATGTSNTPADSTNLKSLLINLPYNDDFIQATGDVLYTTGPNAAGREHITPMPAKHVLEFKGHTIYANLFESPIDTFSIVKTPLNNHKLRVRAYDGFNTLLSQNTFTFDTSPITGTTKTRVCIPTQNANKQAATAETRGSGTLLLGDYRTVQHWLSSVAQSVSADHVLRVPLHQDDATYRTMEGARPYFSSNSALTIIGSGGSTRHLRITPSTVSTVDNNTQKTAQQIDISKFKAPGMCAIVSYDAAVSANTGRIVTIFSYKTVTSLATTGQVEFSECSTVLGDAFANIANAAVTRFFYYLPGVSAANLPLYLSAKQQGYLAVTPIPGNNLMSEVPVATVTRFESGGPGTNVMTAQVQYQAKSKRGQGLINSISYILRVTAARICDAVNGSNLNKFLKAEPGAALGEFVIRAIDPQVTRFTVEYLDSGDNPLTGYLTPECGILNGNETRGLRRPNGIAISNVDFPEVIQRITNGLEQPMLFLPSDQTVMGLAKSTDNVFVFTDKAIWSLLLSTGEAGEPIVLQNQVIDSTVGCIAGGSIQSVAGVVMFLSPTGFQAVTNAGVQPIGTDIDVDVRNAITKATLASGRLNIDKTRSFNNDPRKLYGCYIPGTGTFVYNLDTNRWSKWSLEFDSATVTTSGQLVTTTTIYDGVTPSWQYMAFDKFTDAAPQNAVDQMELNEALTGSTITTTAGTVTISRSGTTTPYTNIKNIATLLSRMPTGTKINYVQGANTYSGVISGTTSSSITIQLDMSIIITPNAATDRLQIGVPVILAFQPHTADAPAELKAYVEWNTHFTAPITGQRWEFRVDSTTTWIPGQTFNSPRLNQTMFRDFIPVQASSGRWLERKLTHDKPQENFQMTAQTVVFRGISGSNSDLGGK